jgi:glycosyltransferase involved in cell wall biosynthesis
MLAAELHDFFRRERVVAVHLHHGLSAIRAARAARRAGVSRVVLTEHSAQPLRDLPWYRRETLRALQHVNAITTVNDEINNFFVNELKVSASRVETIPNAVDPALLDLKRDLGARAALGLEGRFVVGSLGRLHKDKDLPNLIMAFAELTRHRTASTLIVVGDGDERGSLETLVGRLGLANEVRFWGATRDVARLFAVADVFAISSRAEGLPMALLEAMSAGLPCVATRVGGIPDVLSGENGILVSPGDSSALGSALNRLATSPDLARTLGEAARGTVIARYSVASTVDQYLAALGLPARWPADQ